MLLLMVRVWFSEGQCPEDKLPTAHMRAQLGLPPAEADGKVGGACRVAQPLRWLLVLYETLLLWGLGLNLREQ